MFGWARARAAKVTDRIVERCMVDVRWKYDLVRE